MMKINEIFYSIQGESTWVGLPTVFVRTSGCHLRCTYCDTTYAYYEGEKLNLDQIITKINSFGCPRVCLTGGEPLLQEGSLTLMKQLCDLGFAVSLETSGDLSCKDVDSRVKKIIDVKTPDSGEPGRFNRENLEDTNPETEFKFVITSEKDFSWAEKFSEDNNLFSRFAVLYSPSFAAVTPKWLAEKILLAKSRARLQLQMHKYIWSPDQRGI